MKLQLTTVYFLIAASCMAVLHTIATKLFLYWQVWWFDIPMHVLGGAVVALGWYTLYDFRVPLPSRWLRFIPVISWVLIIALVWEYFEVVIGIPIESDHELDTTIDLLMGLVGGAGAYLVGAALRRLRD